MIFVTVGTHEQQFNRLVKCMDELKRTGRIKDEVVIQVGYATYRPEYCKWQETFSYQEVEALVSKADIVITHGGPSSFILPLQMGKIPIVVPRKKEFDEHVNDHQAKFCRSVAERMGTIILIEDIDTLIDAIDNYKDIASGKNNTISSNNAAFNKEFEKLVMNLFR